MEGGLFVQGHFRSYYAQHPVEAPPGSAQREYGYGTFGQKIAQRHLSFPDHSALNRFLVKETPLFISYSAAFYEFPGRRPMAAKNLLRSDLVYEFDADDIPTDCKQHHDTWECTSCETSGKGHVQNCTSCGERVRVEEWVCDQCLRETRKQMQTLLSLLRDDLSITEGISVNFSGSKGYHLHVRNASIQSLSKSARIELLDYLTLHDISLENHGFYLDPESKQMRCPIPKHSVGWSKRILETLEQFVREGNAEQLAAWGGVKISTTQQLLARKGELLTVMQRGQLQQLPGKKTAPFWQALLEQAVQQQVLSIDRQTSADIHKIVRVPDTLHGGTGLKAQVLSVEGLPSHDPLKDSVVFDDTRTTITLKKKTPLFTLGGETFGPFEGGTSIKLPLFAAIYLVARGNADGP